MRFCCDNCKVVFEFDDSINYCPYCGKSFNELYSNVQNSVADTIDSVWGATAERKREFENIINECLDLINEIARLRITKALPVQNRSRFEENYKSFKSSNNRKTLLKRIDTYISWLGKSITDFDEKDLITSHAKLENEIEYVNGLIKDVYDLVGMRYENRWASTNEEFKIRMEVIYPSSKLSELYQQVCVAYEKYKRCVVDNNMFAAFSSTSDYGVMADSWIRWLFSIEQPNCPVKEENTIKISEVMEYMTENNFKKYYGMLDEDFLPHVDAFWFGLENLCKFIDEQIFISGTIESFYVSDRMKSKLSRAINEKSFCLDEARIEFGEVLLERLSEKLNALNS